MERSFALLLVAVLFEVIGTSALKQTAGFTKPGPIAIVVGAYAVAFVLMSFAMKDIPVNVAYAVWSGLGTAGIAIIGWLVYREPFGLWAVVGISMIIGGVVVLHTVGVPHAEAGQVTSSTQGDP